MSRIKGWYVAKVVMEWDLLREPGMAPLEKIKHTLCDGQVTGIIKDTLSTCIGECSVTVDQMYADIYEVEEDGPV